MKKALTDHINCSEMLNAIEKRNRLIIILIIIIIIIIIITFIYTAQIQL